MRAPRILLASVLASMAWLGSPATQSAHAVFLSTLVKADGTSNGGTFVFNGLTFSNFSYQPPTGPPAPTAVTITGVTDAFGNTGIEIGGAFVQAGVGSTDVRLGYTVTGANFTDIHMTGNPVLGTNSTGFVHVTETVSGPNGPLGTILLTDTTVPPSVALNFSSQPFLVVQKDILLTVTGGTAPTPSASISFIDQTFSVPEPASLVLMGLGLGIGGLRLRRRMAVKG